MTTATTREQYVEETKKQLDEWNAQLDRLEGRLGKARETSREELEREMKRAREVYSAARSRLDDLLHAGGAAAEKAEDETKNFMTALDRSIRYFRSQL